MSLIRCLQFPRFPAMRGESRVEASRGGEGVGATFVEENACPRGLPAFPTKARQKRSSVTGRARSRQVFGLTSTAIVTDRFPTGHRFPGAGAQCSVMTFVLDYRCGAVPDSHRVPFSARGTAAQRAPIASDRILRRVERVNRSARASFVHAVRSTPRACSTLRARSSRSSSLHSSLTHRRGVTPRSSCFTATRCFRFTTWSLTDLLRACYGTDCHMPSVPVD